MTAGRSPTEKVRYAFRRCLARAASDDETDAAGPHSTRHLHERFAAKPEDALQAGDRTARPAHQADDVAELAAWTVVGNVLLNLDEMLMKR